THPLPHALPLFAVLAGIYFIALIKHPPQKSVLKPFAYFSECTRLFPEAAEVVLEFRLEDHLSCLREQPRALAEIRERLEHGLLRRMLDQRDEVDPGEHGEERKSVG